MAEFRGAGEAGEAEHAPILFAHSVGAINEVAVTPLRDLREINALSIDETALTVQLINGDGDFAARLAHTTSFDVAEATDGEALAPGAIRIAPGGRHLRIVRSSGELACRLGDDPSLGQHRPSIDTLFVSVATALGAHATGIILTGMGSDGARGLLMMRRAQAMTLGQAEASCTIYGMPKAAIESGAAVEIVAVDHIASTLVHLLSRENEWR